MNGFLGSEKMDNLEKMENDERVLKGKA